VHPSYRGWLLSRVAGEADADVTVTPTLADGTIDRARHAQAALARADAELRAASEEIREATRGMLATGSPGPWAQLRVCAGGRSRARGEFCLVLSDATDDDGGVTHGDDVEG